MPNESQFPPPGLSKPAQRALASKGVTSLLDLTRCTRAEIAALHGMGPKGLRVLEAVLGENEMGFRDR